MAPLLKRSRARSVVSDSSDDEHLEITRNFRRKKKYTLPQLKRKLFREQNGKIESLCSDTEDSDKKFKTINRNSRKFNKHEIFHVSDGMQSSFAAISKRMRQKRFRPLEIKNKFEIRSNIKFAKYDSSTDESENGEVFADNVPVIATSITVPITTDVGVENITSMLRRSRIRRDAVCDDDLEEIDLSDIGNVLEDDVFEDSESEGEVLVTNIDCNSTKFTNVPETGLLTSNGVKLVTKAIQFAVMPEIFPENGHILSDSKYKLTGINVPLPTDDDSDDDQSQVQDERNLAIKCCVERQLMTKCLTKVKRNKKLSESESGNSAEERSVPRKKKRRVSSRSIQPMSSSSHRQPFKKSDETSPSFAYLCSFQAEEFKPMQIGNQTKIRSAHMRYQYESDSGHESDDELFIPARTSASSLNRSVDNNRVYIDEVDVVTSMLQRSRIRRDAVCNDDLDYLELSDIGSVLDDDVFEDSENEIFGTDNSYKEVERTESSIDHLSPVFSSFPFESILSPSEYRSKLTGLNAPLPVDDDDEFSD